MQGVKGASQAQKVRYDIWLSVDQSSLKIWKKTPLSSIEMHEKDLPKEFKGATEFKTASAVKGFLEGLQSQPIVESIVFYRTVNKTCQRIVPGIICGERIKTYTAEKLEKTSLSKLLTQFNSSSSENDPASKTPTSSESHSPEANPTSE